MSSDVRVGARAATSDAQRAVDDTRARFLREIVARVPLERIVEVHMFAPMRQSGAESGVAVIAAVMPVLPVAESSGAEQEVAIDAGELPAELPAGDEPRPLRHTVYTAHYRLVLKGPDRGKWELDVKAEADAPLDSVDAVILGVMKRLGETDDVERLSAEQLRGELETSATWTASR